MSTVKGPLTTWLILTVAHMEEALMKAFKRLGLGFIGVLG